MRSIAVMAEHPLDTPQDNSPPKNLRLLPYFGYSTPDKIIIRGRALEADTSRASNDTPSMVDDLAAMAALFMTREVEGENITIGNATATSDEDGYYRLELPRKSPLPGWTEAVVKAERTGEIVHHPVLITSDSAEYGVISDIDDTIVQSKAWSTRKNLWTSVTGSVGSRYIYPDATTLLKMMAGSMSGRKNPVFYVSSSPWNLHGFLDAVFMANGVVRGPKFLSDFGIDPTTMVADEPAAHKADAIDTVLAANPDLPFYLIGDSGQHDPVIYRDAVLRHPGRIKGVFIRTPVLGMDAEDHVPLKEIEALGVKIFSGATFEPLLDNKF